MDSRVNTSGRSPGTRILDMVKDELANLSPLEYTEALAELDGEISLLIRENDDAFSRPASLELWDSREDDAGYYTRPGANFDDVGFSEMDHHQE